MRLGAGIFARASRSSVIPESRRRIAHRPPAFAKDGDAPVHPTDRLLSLNAGIVVRCLVIAGLIIFCAANEVLRPLDDILSNWRYSALQRPPTGDIVFLEIDATSLKEVSVWPWPRAVHANIVDRLMALGAASVVFDVDFSAASTSENDAALAAALDRAGGYVSLPTFVQRAGAAGGIVINAPIPAFAASSPAVGVELPIGQGGLVRDYPYGLRIGDAEIPSMASAMAGSQLRGVEVKDDGFGIDFAVNVDAIDRISVASLLKGEVDAARVKGRDVVIGASAEELRDFFYVPRFGMIPGALVHILAAETLKQGRAMRDAPFAAVILSVLLLAGLAAAFDHRLSVLRLLTGAAAISIATELVGLLLQYVWALRFNTAAIQLALAAFVIVGVLSDLRLRRRLHIEAARQRDATRTILDQVIADNFDGVIIIDDAMRIISASRLAYDLLGRDFSSEVGVEALPDQLRNALNAVLANAAAGSRRDVTVGETVLNSRAGSEKVIEYVATASAVAGGEGLHVACLTFRDVTERRAHEARLNYLASHDPLTTAWTRHHFIRQIELIAPRDGSGASVALISINLRRFNSVNEVFGHDVGDRVLKAVVARLRTHGHSMVARLGGDNFALASLIAFERAAISKMCGNLIALLREPYAIDDHKIVIGVSLGAATSTGSGVGAEALIARASIAESSAKRAPGSSYEIYSPTMERALREKQSMESALRRAIAGDQFTLDYQPQFDLATGRLIGAEALLRWSHAPWGAMSPTKFVPLAEETGLIVDIGRWALRTACREAARWPSSVRIAVNISPVQLQLADMEAEVMDALALAKLAPSRLEIEITEGVFLPGETEIPATLSRISAQGIGIALDDFGMGYSSLSYLARMPVDKLKIDQIFVREMAKGGEAEAIVQTVVTLAQKLGKSVIAEGVETAEQAELLRRMGCPAAQGFYFGLPMPVAALREVIAAGVCQPPLSR